MNIDYYSLVISKILMPLFMMVVAVFTLWFTYKKNLDLKANKGGRTEEDVPKIIGDGNTIHLSAANLQQSIAYDVDKFDEYHQQSINQSKISFWFSLIFASIGFMVIGTSLFAFSDNSSYVGIVAGTIIDAVSALFFYQSNKARVLMSEFFDRLRSDRKLEESLKLCDSIDNEPMRNALKVKLSMYFAGIEKSDEITSEIISIITGNRKTHNKSSQKDSSEAAASA